MERPNPNDAEKGLRETKAAANLGTGNDLNGNDSSRSWFVCVVCTVLFCGGSVGSRSSGIILVSLAAEFGIPKRQAEWPISIQNFCVFLFQILVAPVAQKFPLKPITFVGATMLGLGFALGAVLPNLTLMTLLFGAVHGAGLALVLVACNTLLTQHFDRYRGLAFGIAHSSSTLASMMFPPLMVVVESNYGFRYAMLIVGIILLSAAPLALLVGDAPWSRKMSSSKGPKHVPGFAWSIFREPIFYILLVPNVVSQWSYDTFLETIEDFANQKGILGEDVQLVLDCFSVADIIGRILIPAVADGGLVSRDILLMISYCLSCVFLLLTCASSSLWHFLATVSILGGFFGLSSSYVFGMVARYIGSERMPFTFGMMGGIGALVFLITPATVGFLEDYLVDFRRIYLSCASLLFVTSLPLLGVIYRRKIGRSLQIVG